MPCGLALKRTFHGALSRPSPWTGSSSARPRVVDRFSSSLPSLISRSLSKGAVEKTVESSRKYFHGTLSRFVDLFPSSLPSLISRSLSKGAVEENGESSMRCLSSTSSSFDFSAYLLSKGAVEKTVESSRKYFHGAVAENGESSRRCLSSTSSSFDFSAYLLSGCDWKHAPSLPDFIGTLAIKPTHDCRGRGLFSSANVAAGDILLVSNPFALSYNDHDSMHLYHKITSKVRQSAKAMYQLACLSGYLDEVIVPDIELFDPNADFFESLEDLDMPDFDPQRVVYVMNTNCFGGEVKLSDCEPASQLNGLWLLPSFINHCCTPNACRIFVGEALLILATTDIKADEEVTISYTDCFLPVHMREDQLESLGCAFFCECNRCVLERSLQEGLLDISEPFEQIHVKAVDEVFSLRDKKCHSTQPHSYACTELCKVYGILLTRLESFDNVTALQKQWIRASYSYGFLAKCFAEYLLSGHNLSLQHVTVAALDLIDSMRSTAPGMKRTLAFIMILANIAKQQGGDLELIRRLDYLAMDECMRVFGKQMPDVTQKLMEQSLESIPFV